MNGFEVKKQYKNFSFEELMTFAENNPNRTHKLESIEVQTIKPIQETPLDTLGLKGYQAFNLNPTGVLSMFACIDDPANYNMSSAASRSISLSNIATELQEKTENLRNTHLARKRKKVYELIGTAFNNGKMDDKDYLELYQGVCYIKGINLVLMKSATQEHSEKGETLNTGFKGEIHFSSNPSLWKGDDKVWIADFRARWIAIPSDMKSKPLKHILAEWITNSEQSGWMIEWPEVDASKEELVQGLSKLPTWTETDKKLKKEILSKRLGKALSIKVFSNWSNKFDLDNEL